MRLPLTYIYLVDKVNRWVYRVTDGRLGGKLLKYPVLVLETVGRKSGQVRSHALLYVPDGKNMVIIGSNNGQSHHPGWYFNLKADPHASVQAGRQRYKVQASFAEGEEYERLWKKFLALRPQYADYLKRTTRHFPIVILQPVFEKNEVG